ncbi:MAG: response regulator [Oligoflexales bacterium]
MSILIVEDDEITATRLAEQLEKREYETTVLEDGESCLELIKTQPPTLILLDYMLPGISGLEVLSEVRKLYSMVELPIILATAKNDPAEVVKALKLGANDYITKPINIEILTARIRTQIGLNQYYIESLRNNELETLNAMIVTYNHEINTPLTSAMHNMEILQEIGEKNQKHLEDALSNLQKITSILNKIRKVTKNPITKKSYIGKTKMINIDKKTQ